VILNGFLIRVVVKETEKSADRRRWWWAVTLLALLLPALVGCGVFETDEVVSGAGSDYPQLGTAATTREPVVAVVGELAIPLDDLEREIGVGRALYRASKGEAPGKVDEAAVIRQLVDDLLVLRAAKEAGISVTEAEVTAAVQQVLRSQGITEQALQTALETEGVTMQDLRDVVRRALLVDRYVRQYIAVDMPPEEASVALTRWLETQRVESKAHMQQIAAAEPVVSRGDAVVGGLTPNFTLSDLAGTEVTPRDFQGQTVLFYFWATWCPSCQATLSVLKELHAKYRDRGFQVLAVSVQEQSEEVQAFTEALKLGFPVLLDEIGAVARRYRVRGLPTSFFVNPKGTIVAIQAGAMERDVLEASIQRAMGSTERPRPVTPPADDEEHELHWHVRLQILIDGRERQLYNLEGGQFIDVHRPNTTLGEALEELGIEYDVDCILDLCREGERRGRLVVRINGEVVENFAAYLLRDGDEVVMELKR